MVTGMERCALSWLLPIPGNGGVMVELAAFLWDG